MERTKRYWQLTGVLATMVAAAGILGGSATAVVPGAKTNQTAHTINSIGDNVVISNSSEPAVYIVRFRELPVALYDGSQAGFAAPERVMRNKHQRLSLQSAAAKSYESFLVDKQNQRLIAMNQMLGRIIPPRFTLKHALNAVVMELTATEAEQVAKIDGVVSVEREKNHALTTDIGPSFIGAPPLWWDVPTATQDTMLVSGFESAAPYQGEGTVVGLIDTGYNSASPSFSATDQFGYAITNPLGAGNYLGQCNVPGISVANCNSKVIGVYDFVNDGSAGNSYSVEDFQGHGSHTASTAAGNHRIAQFDGKLTHMSGIAPHSNLVIFSACKDYDGWTGCPESATVASIDQAIQDGIVDVLNYSISGGKSPWKDNVSMAFLSATNAGIFVAASAGNSGPMAIWHQEPWVTSVAASSNGRGGAQADQLASFSSLGPGDFDVIKPDVQAPGVSVLAAVNRGAAPGNPNGVGLKNGTSMASPHTAGAGALLAGLHPDWTPMEIKSALMMTAKQAGLTKSDGVTPSDPFDRGSGSIRVNLANKAGLVLNETYTNFLNAEPRVNGDPSTLNLASMQDSNCQTITSPTTSSSTCSFTRTFRSTQNHDVTWAATVTGLNTTITPSSFTVAANGTSGIVVNVDASNLPSDGISYFGELTLTPDDTNLLSLHLPMAISVPRPNISTYTTDMNIHIPNNVTERGISLVVLNTGGPTLNVTNTNLVDDVPQHTAILLDQWGKSSNGSAYPSTFRTDVGLGSYATDDFVVSDVGTNLRRIGVMGDVGSETGQHVVPLADLPGRPIHFQIYRNYLDTALNLNKPDGAPEGSLTPNNPPVWSYTTAVGAPGVTINGNYLSDINLDLVAAGAPPTNLNPGTYWLIVYVDMNYSTQGGWYWYQSSQDSGSSGMAFYPVYGGNYWSPFSKFAGPTGFTMRIEKQIGCGAPWLSTDPATLTLPGMISQEITVIADSTKFPAGQTEATAYLCLQSNDPDEPVRVIRVNAAQLQ